MAAEQGQRSSLIIAKIIIKPLIRVEFTPTWAGFAVEIKAGIHLVGQGVARGLRVAGNAAIWTIGAPGEFNTCKNWRTAKSYKHSKADNGKANDLLLRLDVHRLDCRHPAAAHGGPLSGGGGCHYLLYLPAEVEALTSSVVGLG